MKFTSHVTCVVFSESESSYAISMPNSVIPTFTASLLAS